MLKLTENFLSEEGKKLISNSQLYRSNTVVLINPDKIPEQSQRPADDTVFECDLFVDSNTPATPIRQSQYIIDYDRKTLFYFNLLHEGHYKHFQFPIDFKTRKQIGKPLPPHPLQANLNSQTLLFKLGLCCGEDRVFLVYGKFFDGQNSTKDVGSIVYFDTVKEKWHEPKIAGASKSAGPILPRNSVTCNYFKLGKSKNDPRYIYIFGGDSDEHENEGRTRIYNIVEFVMLDFEANVFTHFSFKKQSLFSDQYGPYIPYLRSIALQFGDNILILGGERFGKSIAVSEESKLFCFK